MAVLSSLCQTWSETRKTDFLTSGLILTHTSPFRSGDETTVTLKYSNGGCSHDTTISVPDVAVATTFSPPLKKIDQSQTYSYESSCYIESNKMMAKYKTMLMIISEVYSMCPSPW